MFAVVLTLAAGRRQDLPSVLTALADALTDDNVRQAAIDVEALWSHPAPKREQRTRHVKAVCALYHEAGHRLLLLAETIETQQDLDRLLDAVRADEYFLVRLEAQPATLAKRITGQR